MTVGAFAAAVALVIAPSVLAAQPQGPTVTAARVALAAPAIGGYRAPRIAVPASCGSALKNAMLLGLGLSLATAAIELTYTIVREPFVRNGHDVPGADPTLITWAGAAGFIGGLVGTELCRRRR